MPIFIAALIKIAKMLKQAKYPSKDEWINKMWYVHTMKYYLSGTCYSMDESWENYAEWNKSVTEKYCMIGLIWGIRSSQIHRHKK